MSSQNNSARKVSGDVPYYQVEGAVLRLVKPAPAIPELVEPSPLMAAILQYLEHAGV